MSSGTGARGELRIGIHWPSPAKLIPLAAQSISIGAMGPGNQAVPLTYNGKTNNVIVVARPPAGQNSSTVDLTDLPAVPIALTATAYPNADGSGVAQATGAQVVTISSATPANVSLTMASTVTSVAVGVGTSSLTVGQTTPLVATAKDSAGNTVLVEPSTWKWSSSNVSVASLTGSGASVTLNALAAGAPVITASYSEPSSPVSGTATLTITSGGSTGGSVTFQTLYNFNTTVSTGRGRLVVDSQGNIYGESNGGQSGTAGCIFKLAPNGTLTVLHSFNYWNKNGDGLFPEGGLIADTQGDLYGTTAQGGANGFGTVFEQSENNSKAYATLHSFVYSDGYGPECKLAMDAQGNLYGTTYYSGVNDDGTIFKIAPGALFTNIYDFPVMHVGIRSGMYVDAQGNLYGTTEAGGLYWFGDVYELTPNGVIKILHNFNATDGVYPERGSLTMDALNNLYGCASADGAYNRGVVFKLTPSNGAYTVLHSFNGTDGAYPLRVSILLDSQGNLYGTTEEGGAYNKGVVFKLTPNGAYTILHSFDGTDGWEPSSGLTMDSQGNLYGITEVGGANNLGTIYEIKGAVSSP